ncbi:MAG: hypothetical protein ACP5HQ_01590 [Thermoprotei archaeon]
MIFACKKVVDDVAQELERQGLEPKVIGKETRKREEVVNATEELANPIHRESVPKYFKGARMRSGDRPKPP